MTTYVGPAGGYPDAPDGGQGACKDADEASEQVATGLRVLSAVTTG